MILEETITEKISKLQSPIMTASNLKLSQRLLKKHQNESSEDQIQLQAFESQGSNSSSAIVRRHNFNKITILLRIDKD